ncbi:hypothetical protein KUV89_09145 [Marinobacter hydrocarbonoclasticus]|nr:hypothetical protein [Marinobacter nauticus]
MELDLIFQQELIKAIAAFNGDRSWYESPAAIALASGLVAILGGIISHLFNLHSENQRKKSEYDMVRLESEIRKQESIHDKQIEALMALSKINRDLQPTIWSSPDYDSNDAYSDVVFSMGRLLSELDNFQN